MILYEIKVSYERQTGEENPGKVKELYLVEGITCTDVETRLMDELQPLISGDCEVSSCRKVQFYDVVPSPEADRWYKARVEMITIDNDKETRKAVTILVQADNVSDALKNLQKYLVSMDCEIISLQRSAIIEFYRAV